MTRPPAPRRAEPLLDLELELELCRADLDAITDAEVAGLSDPSSFRQRV